VSELASAALRGGRRSFLRALLVVAAGVMAGFAGASSGQSWTPQPTRDAHPSARDGHWMTYDSASRSILLFGGKENNSQELNDLWSYEATTGTSVAEMELRAV
jgi:hypothetical protein